MKENIVAVENIAVTPDTQPVAVVSPYQAAERNMYTRAAGETLGLDIPQGQDPTDMDFAEIVKRAKDDDIKTSQMALARLVEDPRFSEEQRELFKARLVEGFKAIQQGQTLYSQYELAQKHFDRSAEEKVAADAGVLDDEAERIYDRTVERPEVAVAATQVRNKQQAAAVSAAAAAPTAAEANRILLAERAAADAEYNLLSSKPKDWLQTGMELIPGMYTHENQVYLELFKESGIPALVAEANKYSGLKGGGKAVFEGTGEIKTKWSNLVASLSPQDKIRFANTIKRYRTADITENIASGRTLALQNVLNTLTGKIPEEPTDEVQGPMGRLLDDFINLSVNTIGRDRLEYAGEALDSFASFVDPLPLVGLVGRGARVTRQSLRTGLRLGAVSRQPVAKELAAVVKAGTTGVSAEAADEVPEIIASSMPKSTTTFDRTNLSVDLAKNLEEIDAATSRYFEQLNDVVAAPIAAPTANAPQAAKAFVESKGLNGSAAMSEFTMSEGGDAIVVRGRFGAGDNVGYKTLEDAQDAVRRTGVIDEADVTYALRDKNSGVVYTPKDGKLNDIVSALARTEKGKAHFEWYVQADTQIPTNRLLYADGVVDNPIKGEGVSWFRRLLFGDASPFKNAYSTLSNRIVANMKRAAGNKYYAEDVFKSMYNRAASLVPDKEWGAVNNAMRKTQEAGRTLDKAELDSIGVKSDKAVAGYYAFQKSLEVSYHFANKGLSKTMASEGWYKLSGPRGGTIAYGMPLKKAPQLETGVATRFLDEPIESGVRNISGVEMDELIKQGYSMYRTQAKEWAGRVEVGYIAVAPGSKAATARAVREGDDVLPRVAGYFPESLSDNFVVYGEKAGRKWIVATARNSNDAQKFVESQYANGALKEGTEYADKFDSLNWDAFGMSGDVKSGVAEGIYENLGGLVYGQKGGDIISLSGPKGSNYLDPLEAVYKTFNLIADNYTKGAYVQFLENSLVRSIRKYPSLLKNPSDVQNIGAVTKEDLVSRAPRGLEKVLQEAKAAIDALDVYKLMPDPSMMVVSRIADSIAMRAAKWPAMQELAMKISKGRISPVDFVKKYRYFTSIRMRPFPHYQMNALNAVLNAGWPVSSGKALVTHGLFQNAIAARLDYAAGLIGKAEYQGRLAKLNKYSKVTGMDAGEWGRLADTYVEQGLWSQVRHNSITAKTAMTDAQLVGEAAGAGLGAKAKRGFQSASAIIDSVGAQAGEHFSTEFTFLAQYFAMKGKNAKLLRTPDGRNMLGARTQDILGNMVSEGRIGLQRGWLSAYFQFMAYPIKMQMILTPGAQPTTLSKLDSLRLMIGALPVYGWRVSDGTAAMYKTWLNNYINDPEHPERREAWDKNPLRQGIEQGLTGYSVDQLIKTAAVISDPDMLGSDQDWEQWDMAGRAGIGASIGPVYDKLLEGAKSFVELGYSAVGANSATDYVALPFKAAELLLGLDNSALTVASRYASMYANMSDDATPEDLDGFVNAAGLDVLSKMMPVMGDYWRYKMMQKYEMDVRSGAPTGRTGKATMEDFYYKVLMGGTLAQSEADYYRAMARVDGIFSRPENYQKEVKDTASNLVKYMFSEVMLEGLGKDLMNQVMQKHMFGMQVMYAGMDDPQFKRDVEAEVDRILRDYMKRETKEGKLVRQYIGEIRETDLNEKGSERIRRITNSGVGESDKVMAEELANFWEQLEYVGGEK